MTASPDASASGKNHSQTKAGAKVSAAAGTEWPSAVQPKVDKFVALASTTGLAMFKEMENAKATTDLTGRSAQPDVRKLRNAEMDMRSALGLANPTAG